MTTLVLLRHGETLLTPERRLSGSGGSNPGLSPAGRRQAQAAAEALAHRDDIAAVVTSPMRRCRETAHPVAARLGLNVQIDRDLREADFGAWEGLTFNEVRERYPDDLNAWFASPESPPSGAGETMHDITRRVTTARDALLARHTGTTILIVSHVVPLRTLIRLALQAPPHTVFRMEVAAGSLSTVTYEGDGTAMVRALNDTHHLACTCRNREGVPPNALSVGAHGAGRTG
ncbi:histidine phosphatase family protein [Streptomyces sp. NPDC051963]|uniref:histidine phosphatase family protein n=1 Tax=Streptomyces sp. NPDC051963 TaxID=3365678 RepID=UPI0037D26F66